MTIFHQLHGSTPLGVLVSEEHPLTYTFKNLMKKSINQWAAVNTAACVLAFIPSLSAGVSDELPLCDKGEEHHHHSGNPAPIGVMGSHLHEKGGLMASYRWMRMKMEGSFDGDSSISDTQAGVNPQTGAGYMMTPTDMQMDMHMLSVMYAPSDQLTLMLLTSYLENSMSMVNNMTGATMNMESSGWSDIKLTALHSIYKKQNSSAHFGLGVSAPTGSIDEEMANMPMNMGYVMQLGSGTWDLLPSVTWQGHSDTWSYGSQASAVIRLGRNDNGYSQGDKVSLTGWVSRQLCDHSSVSVRLTASDWGNVDGADDAMNPMMTSLADPNLRGGSSVDLALGFSVWSDAGARLSVEAATPVYQNLDGPQMGTDWTLTTGLQFSW